MRLLPSLTKYLSLSLVLISNAAYAQSQLGQTQALPISTKGTTASAGKIPLSGGGAKPAIKTAMTKAKPSQWSASKRKASPCKKKWTPKGSNKVGETLSPLGQAVQKKTAQGDYVGAIALCQEAINTQPNDWDAYLNRAIVKRQIGDLKGAIADLDQSLALKPDSAVALVNRAAAYRRLNEMKLARADVDRAIEIAPRYYQAYTERGSLLMTQGDFNGALADYNTASTINPDLSKRTGRYVQPNLTANMNMAVAENNGQRQISLNGNGLNMEVAQLAKKFSGITNGECAKKALSPRPSDATTASIVNADNSENETAKEPSLSAGELAQMNNRAVEEINHKQFLNAIYTLKDLLKLSPNYDNARENLVIAYNNYGLELAAKSPKESLKQFHAALYLDPRQTSTRKNLESMICELGLNHKHNQDRLSLADDCLKENDLEGAYVELIESLKLKNSLEARKKLSETLALLDGQPKSLSANNRGLVGIIESFGLNPKLNSNASSTPTPAAQDTPLVTYTSAPTANPPAQAMTPKPVRHQEPATKIKLESPSAIPADLIGKELPQSKLRTNLTNYSQKLRPLLLNKTKVQATLPSLQPVAQNPTKTAITPQAHEATAAADSPAPYLVAQQKENTTETQANDSASNSTRVAEQITGKTAPEIAAAQTPRAASSSFSSPELAPQKQEETVIKASQQERPSLEGNNEEEIAINLQNQNFDLVSLPSKLQNDPESILLLAKELTGKGDYKDGAYLLVKLIDFLHHRSTEQVSVPLLDSSLENLADIYIKGNYWGKAEPLLRELVNLREKSKNPEDPLLGKAHSDYSQVLNQLGQEELAQKHKEKSLVIINRSF